METIKKKLYFALKAEGLGEKQMAVLRQCIDLFVLKHGCRTLIDNLQKDGWYCFSQDGEYRVSANKDTSYDYITIL